MNQLDLAIHRLALTQHGLITAADAARLGMSPHGIKHRQATGQWERLAKRVWRVTTQPVTWLQRLHAAQLALGEPSWISHHSAAALYGFEGFTANPTPTVHVLVPWRRRGMRGPWTLHAMGRNQPLPLPNLEVTTHDPTGLRMTTPARTVLDLSTLGLSDDQLGDAIDAAIRMGRASPQHLLQLLERRPASRHRGEPQLRRLLTDAGGTNRLERAMLAWLRAEGLPRPETQRTLRTNGRRIARLDFRFPDVRVSLEVSGALGHSSLAARRRHADIVHAAQHQGELLVELMTDQVFQRQPQALHTIVTTRHHAYVQGMFRPGYTPDPRSPFR